MQRIGHMIKLEIIFFYELVYIFIKRIMTIYMGFAGMKHHDKNNIIKVRNYLSFIFCNKSILLTSISSKKCSKLLNFQIFK